MSNLKELTWEHHKAAERQEFVREMFSSNLSKERYATFLFNQHPQYNLLEVFAMVHGILDVRRAPAIHEDYQELWTDTNKQPPLLPVVKEYMDHLVKIQNDPDKLMAHIYVRHMGDLSGGQMLAKRVPGSGKMYQFNEPVEELKERIRARLNDSMADEAKICFDFATKLFQQMSEVKE
jgi:heme oxygenase